MTEEIEEPWSLDTYKKHRPQKAEEESDERREFRKTVENKWDEPELPKIKPKPTKPKPGIQRAEEDVQGPIRPVETHLPTPREEHDFKTYKNKINVLKKVSGLPNKAEEVTMKDRGVTDAKQLERKDRPLSMPSPETVMKERQTRLPPMKSEEEDDPLVFPDEYKMGLKEETEHADVTGGDKEATKKIVLAHLVEDPHYYTKLGTVMKAEEELSPFRHVDVKTDPTGPTYKRKNVPSSTMLFNVPKEKRVGDKQAINVHEKKAEEDQIKWTPKPSKPKPAEPLKQSPKDEIESFLQLHQKAEEEGGIMNKIKDTIKDLTTSPKVESYQKPLPLTKTNVRQQHKRSHGAGEDKELGNDSLNELYNFMMWLIEHGHTPDKDKNFAKLINQYDVEKFSSEQEKQSDSDKLGEMEKPARFKAEPKDGV